jgi:hypothetical protein
MKHSSVILTLLLILNGISCKRESALPDIRRLGLDYFPLEINSYKVYDVQEVEYTLAGERYDNYQLMSEIESVFINDAGDSIYTINRYIRTDENGQWELVAVWSAERDNYKAIVTEENVAYQKLSFPIQSEVVWDGNAYNIFEEEEYRYESVGENFTTDNDQLYENTIIVVQNDLLDTIVEWDYRIEAHARGIGLIYKEMTNLYYCTEDYCRGHKIIETGNIYRQSLLEYGKN